MAYPLIIFGAGASHDYTMVSGRPFAPLTRELVIDEFLPFDLMRKYEGAGNLLGRMVPLVRDGRVSFEQALTSFVEGRDVSPYLEQQLLALEFYLKELFGRISNKDSACRDYEGEKRHRAHEVNNYRAIIDYINLFSNGKASVVTFNYDSLFEDSLGAKQRPLKMKDYVTHDLKIFKLHGSHDWAYIIDKDPFARDETPFEYCTRNAGVLRTVQLNASSFQPHHTSQLDGLQQKDDFHQLPALAIPLIGKDRYVCPQGHIDHLLQVLPQVDRILVVGWRGADPQILQTLKENLPNDGYKLLIVSNNETSAKEVSDSMRSVLPISEKNVSTFSAGFTGFIGSQDILSDFFLS